MLRLSIIPLLLPFIFSTCGGAGDIEPPAFSGERAYEHLVDQVAFGPRVPGTEASETAREYYYDHFTRMGLSIDSQAFMFRDPYSQTDIPLVNVIARYRGNPNDEKAILLMAHYDSRPRTDRAIDSATHYDQPIDGANDGASGVAVLMELATLFNQSPPGVNVDLVLFDGEDWGKEGHRQFYLLGSREFARRGIRDDYHYGIVVDLIGDKDQQIYREIYSESFVEWLNDYVWGVAERLEIPTFYDTTKYTVLDDHMSINAGGVPCIVIIDFDYPWWHTEFDTPDKCSPTALANVGRVLAEIVYRPSTWPEKK